MSLVFLNVLAEMLQLSAQTSFCCWVCLWKVLNAQYTTGWLSLDELMHRPKCKMINRDANDRCTWTWPLPVHVNPKSPINISADPVPCFSSLTECFAYTKAWLRWHLGDDVPEWKARLQTLLRPSRAFSKLFEFQDRNILAREDSHHQNSLLCNSA